MSIRATQVRDRRGNFVTRYRTPGGIIVRPDTTDEQAKAIDDAAHAKQRLPRRARVVAPHYRVDEFLTDPAFRAEYEALLADRTQTGKSLQAWLAGRGHAVSVTGVQNHRRRFLMDQRPVADAARLAEHYAAAARRHGPAAMAEAAATRYEQLLMARLFQLDEDALASELPKPRDWLDMAKAANGVVAGRRTVEALREEYEERARKAAALLAEQGEELDDEAKRDRLVRKVREVLGIPTDDLDREAAIKAAEKERFEAELAEIRKPRGVGPSRPGWAEGPYGPRILESSIGVANHGTAGAEAPGKCDPEAGSDTEAPRPDPSDPDPSAPLIVNGEPWPDILGMIDARIAREAREAREDAGGEPVKEPVPAARTRAAKPQGAKWTPGCPYPPGTGIQFRSRGPGGRR